MTGGGASGESMQAGALVGPGRSIVESTSRTACDARTRHHRHCGKKSRALLLDGSAGADAGAARQKFSEPVLRSRAPKPRSCRQDALRSTQSGARCAALGVAAAWAALTLAVRRGRRLAKVSAELAQRNGELEERSALRVRRLAAACHDLRQPAHALGMLAELGGEAQRDPSRFVAWLQSVRRSTASLGEMLDELMVGAGSTVASTHRCSAMCLWQNSCTT